MARRAYGASVAHCASPAPSLSTLRGSALCLARAQAARLAVQRCPPRLHQLRPLRARGREMALLHVAVAADLLGDARDLGGLREALGAQRLQQLVDARPVLVDQRALGPALLGAAEDVERGAAQPLESARARRRRVSIQGPNGRLDELALARSASRSPAARGGSSACSRPRTAPRSAPWKRGSVCSRATSYSSL